jgi:hypothetical protein
LTGAGDAAQRDRPHWRGIGAGMTKILSLLMVGLMVIQIIKPLGLPGLKRRADFWKLAVIAFAMIVVTAGLSHSPSN